MKKAATEIKKKVESSALYLHCYGRTNLAVLDTLKCSIKSMCHALDMNFASCEILSSKGCYLP